MTDWTEKSLEQAKQLAPWRSNLPWWVALIEGIVLGIVGILVLLDPRQTSVNVALFLTVVLLVAGILQTWSTLRNRVPENVRGVVLARAAVAIFTGINIWLMYFMGILTLDVGRIIFGLGSLVYGLLGFFVVFGTHGAQRRTSLIESIFFTAVGLIMIYVHFAGPGGVITATRIVGWLAILSGLVISALAIWRQRQGAAADEKIEQVESKVEEMTTAIQAEEKKLAPPGGTTAVVEPSATPAPVIQSPGVDPAMSEPATPTLPDDQALPGDKAAPDSKA